MKEMISAFAMDRATRAARARYPPSFSPPSPFVAFMAPHVRCHTPYEEVRSLPRAAPLLDPRVLDAFTFEVAEDLGIHLRPDYNGDLRAKDAGRIGGRIGGRMVRLLIRYAESSLWDEGANR
jgi:small acid-soluble spore protein D (minor alpha/beta-type SASP)